MSQLENQLKSLQNSSQKTILVVDDDQNLLEAIVHIIKHSKYNVIVAHNGLEAISLYKNCHPDLVLMDVKMPKMDGCTAFYELRNHDPDAKIVFMTGYGIDDRVFEAAQQGLLETVDKPFNTEKVRKLLADYLESG